MSTPPLINAFSQVQGVRLVSQTTSLDAFPICRGIFRKEFLVPRHEAGLKSGLTARKKRKK
jgi:hypothetical protein